MISKVYFLSISLLFAASFSVAQHHNLPQSTISYRVKNEKETPYQKDIHTYNAKGRLVKTEHHKYKKGEWLKNKESQYEYINGVIKTSTVLTILTNGEFSAVKKDSSIYDKNGHKTKKIDFSWSNIQAIWNKVSETSYTYNSSNQLISEVHTQKFDQTRNIKTENTYSYNKKNLVDKITNKNYNYTGQLESQYETKFTYSNNGKLLNEQIYNSGLYLSNGPFLYKEIKYIYDKRGRLITKETYNYRKEKASLTKKEVISY